MVNFNDLKEINKFEWEIPQSFRADMRVPVRIFATRQLLSEIMDDKSLEQAVNAATLPGLVGHVVVMPDMHQGYGFPIGGVAATQLPDGVISPGAIGYDINCGVRLLASQIPFEAASPSRLSTPCSKTGIRLRGILRTRLERLHPTSVRLWRLRKNRKEEPARNFQDFFR